MPIVAVWKVKVQSPSKNDIKNEENQRKNIKNRFVRKIVF